jgi:hypothetical protein
MIDQALFRKARGFLVHCILTGTPDYRARAMGGAPGWRTRLGDAGDARRKLDKALADLGREPARDASSDEERAVENVILGARRCKAKTIVQYRTGLRKGVLSGWSKERVAHIVEELYWSGLLLSARQPFTPLTSSSGRGPFAIDEAIVRAYFPEIDFARKPLKVPPPAPPAPATLPLDVEAWKIRVHAIDPAERAAAWQDVLRHNREHKPLPFSVLRELHDPRWTNMPLFFDYKGELTGSRDPATKPRKLADMALPSFAGAPASIKS